MLERVGLKETSECDRRESFICFEPVRRFFPHSNLSQTTIVSAQNKSQRASHEIFSKLVSTLRALIHLDCKSPKVPLFHASRHVRFAIRTSWHNLPPFKVIDSITIYHFHYAFTSKSSARMQLETLQFVGC
jgi:hypothetical protein